MSTVELTDHRWRTTLAVVVRGRGADHAAGAVRQIFHDEVERLERTASRFRPDSEITRANASAGTWVEASRSLSALVEVALAAAESTEGLVSPCLGRQVDAEGYRSWAAGEVVALRLGRPVPCDPGAWRHVRIAGGRLRFPGDVTLDLGATAKAWLADQVAERIADETGLDVVANMGGDLRAIALGPQPWVVAIDHETPGAAVRSLEVVDAGLATSSQGARRWRTAAGPAHHLIDPRTGRSALTRWWAVSVLGASATAANTASTAAMLLDTAASGWLERRGLDAALTEWDGAATTPAATRFIGRWPTGQEAA